MSLAMEQKVTHPSSSLETMKNIDDHPRSSVLETTKNIDDHPRSSVLETMKNIDDHPRSSILETTKNIDDHPRSSVLETTKNIDDHPRSSVLETMKNIDDHPRSSVLETMKNIASNPDQEDPFYVLELEDIVSKVQEFRSLLPRVEVFYGVKCNDDGTVLETLVSLGVHFVCSSKGEISKVLSLGVCPSRIIYAHPYKTKLDLEFVSEVQVSLITFDSREELLKIKEIYPKAELVLKVNFDAPQSDGTSVEDSISLLSLVRDLNLAVVGVSIHIGTCCNGADVYKRAIAAVQQIYDEGKALGMNMNLLDIGDGFPLKPNGGIGNFASDINEALNSFFPIDKHSNLKCDEGGNEQETVENSKFWGPSLCPFDVLNENINFPRLECGHWIYWPDMGAYTLTSSTEFNGYPVPEVHVIRMSSSIN